MIFGIFWNNLPDRCLKIIHDLSELDEMAGPKLVLASLPSLETGFSARLFREWAQDSANTVILPDKGPVGSLCRKLYDSWKTQTVDGEAQDKLRSPVSVNLDLSITVLFASYLQYR